MIVLEVEKSNVKLKDSTEDRVTSIQDQIIYLNIKLENFNANLDNQCDDFEKFPNIIKV